MADDFEIVDFTVATPWEKLVVAIEEHLQAPPASPVSLAFDGVELHLEVLRDAALAAPLPPLASSFVTGAVLDTLPAAQAEALEDGRDFPLRSHCLQRWFGPRLFVLVRPADAAAVDPSQAALLHSALAVAMDNVGWTAPVFVPLHQRWRGAYTGYSASPDGFVTRFEADSQATVPQGCGNLSGLLDLFAAKLALAAPSESPMHVSARLVYVVTFFDQVFEPDAAIVAGVEGIPWGPEDDPVTAFNISACWTLLSQDGIVDNSVYSQLTPDSAHSWSVQCVMQEADLDTLDPTSVRLARRVYNLHAACVELTGVGSFHALKQNLQQRATALSGPLNTGFLPSAEEIDAIMQALFAHGDADQPDGSDTDAKAEWSPPCEASAAAQRLKGADAGSLLSLLAVHMATMGSLKAMALLWGEFTNELRWHWDNLVPVPKVPAGPPDQSQHIMQQKLQMLNCCIATNAARQANSDDPDGWDTFDFDDDEASGDADGSGASGGGNDGSKDADSAAAAADGDDDEFFDSLEDVSEWAWEEDQHRDREGSKAPINDVVLLRTKTRMHEPHTQPHRPMTEDMVQEQLEIFARLGTSAEAAKIRAKMQSATLRSDMEAFKAANPGSVLEDFVRWHSPRDWVDADDNSIPQASTDGRLSQRMAHDGLWRQLWAASKPVAASKQKPVFDATKEAEVVLHWFEAIVPRRLMWDLLHIASVSALAVLQECTRQAQVRTGDYEQLLADFVDHVPPIETADEPDAVFDAKLYEGVARRLALLELAVAKACSAASKLSPHRDLTASLLESFDVSATDPTQKALVKDLVLSFFNMDDDEDEDEDGSRDRDGDRDGDGDGGRGGGGRFPEPDAREFVIRCLAPRPFPHSRVSAHRMYALLKPNEFRVATMISADE